MHVRQCLEVLGEVAHAVVMGVSELGMWEGKLACVYVPFATALCMRQTGGCDVDGVGALRRRLPRPCTEHHEPPSNTHLVVAGARRLNAEHALGLRRTAEEYMNTWQYQGQQDLAPPCEKLARLRGQQDLGKCRPGLGPGWLEVSVTARVLDEGCGVQRRGWDGLQAPGCLARGA